MSSDEVNESFTASARRAFRAGAVAAIVIGIPSTAHALFAGHEENKIDVKIFVEKMKKSQRYNSY